MLHMKTLLKLSFLLIIIVGCSTTDDQILCETGPVGFNFEVLNEATGENIFANGFEEHQLQIKDKQEKSVDFTFDNERKVINVLLGWEPKSSIYSVTIGEDDFDIVFTLEKSSSAGCTSTKLTALEIVGATFQRSKTSDITTIFLSTAG